MDTDNRLFNGSHISISYPLWLLWMAQSTGLHGKACSVHATNKFSKADSPSRILTKSWGDNNWCLAAFSLERLIIHKDKIQKRKANHSSTRHWRLRFPMPGRQAWSPHPQSSNREGGCTQTCATDDKCYVSVSRMNLQVNGAIFIFRHLCLTWLWISLSTYGPSTVHPMMWGALTSALILLSPKQRCCK